MLVAWAVASLGSSSSACGAGTVWAASSPKCGGDPAAGCCVPVERRVVLERRGGGGGGGGGDGGGGGARGAALGDRSCEWLVPTLSGFAGVTYDLNAIPKGVLHNGAAGYNVTNGEPGASGQFEYVFGVCEEVALPATPGCEAQTSIPPTAAAYQIGVYNPGTTSIWSTTCNSIGDIDASRYSLVDATNPVAGVEVTFTKGNIVGCPFSRQLSISFVCDPDYRAIARDQAVTEETTCIYHMEVKTAYGCPKECGRGANGQLCSGTGSCGYNRARQTAQCICDEGWQGADCSEGFSCGVGQCGSVAAGSVVGTAAAVGLAGLLYVRRGGDLTAKLGASARAGQPVGGGLVEELNPTPRQNQESGFSAL